MGAGSERSVRQVAERGYNLLLGQYDLPEDVLRHIAQFKKDVEARGRKYDPMEVGTARAVHFADTPEELEAAQIRRLQGHLRINKLAEKPGDARERFARHDEAEVRRLCDDTAIFGTPDQIPGLEIARRRRRIRHRQRRLDQKHPPLRQGDHAAFRRPAAIGRRGEMIPGRVRLCHPGVARDRDKARR